MSSDSLLAERVFILRKLRDLGGAAYFEDICAASKLPDSLVHRVLLECAQQGLVTVEEEVFQLIELTDKGRVTLERGLPEYLLAKTVLHSGGQLPLQDALKAAGIEDRKEREAAVGWLVRRQLGRLQRTNKEVLIIVTHLPQDELYNLLNKVSTKAVLFKELTDEEKSAIDMLRRRGLVKISSKIKRFYRITEQGLKDAQKEVPPVVTRLTPELIRSGAWRRCVFARYDVSALPPLPSYGFLHPYLEFLDQIREFLMSRGFEEIEGRLVETEFWNFDVLFQPQDHPARELHDTLKVLKPRDKGPLPSEHLLKSVMKMHERYWKYRYDIDVARRLILRSQTTATTINAIVGRRPPFKLFTIGRVYRHDKIDSRHLVEFYQCDGVMGYYGASFKDLLRFFRDLANYLGLEVRFFPGYFPFTEPSVEGYVKHPTLGWVECLPGGLFRREILKALDVDCPVIAWALGLERLFMAMYNIDDIRLLFTDKLGKGVDRGISW